MKPPLSPTHLAICDADELLHHFSAQLTLSLRGSPSPLLLPGLPGPPV